MEKKEQHFPARGPEFKGPLKKSPYENRLPLAVNKTEYAVIRQTHSIDEREHTRLIVEMWRRGRGLSMLAADTRHLSCDSCRISSRQHSCESTAN